MPVDPEIKAVLDFIASRGLPPFYELSPPEAREATLKARAVYTGGEVPLPRVENRTVPGPAGPIPVRLFAAETGRPLPVLVYIHGGGWVIGSVDSYDEVCRRLAVESGCLVLSVDYRLAPEHPFPAAVDDCRAVVEWVAAHGAEVGADPARIAVGGDSAGGNLTAVVTQQLRDAGGPAIAFQLLVYPATDADFSRPSYAAHGAGYLLTMEAVTWFWNHYLPTVAGRADPAAAPLRAASLAGLPPALVQLAELDVLYDEGVAYAKGLEAAGVPVQVREYPGAVHGFFAMAVAAVGRQALADAGRALREALKP